MYDPTRPVYLRIGDWNPDFPFSRNYARGTVEAGLSVYDLDEAWKPIPPTESEWAERDLEERLRSNEPRYYVQGDLVGEGHDGEPLIRNPKIVSVPIDN